MRRAVRPSRSAALLLAVLALAGCRAVDAPAAERPPAPATAPSAGAGAAAVGSTHSPVPSRARHVAPSGDDGGPGTAGRPWRTVAHAVAVAPDGATVVLSGGTYHESVVLPGDRRLALQPAPGGAVRFDGSREVTGWVADAADRVVIGSDATQGVFVGGRDQGEDVVLRAVTVEGNGLSASRPPTPTGSSSSACGPPATTPSGSTWPPSPAA